MKKNSATPNDFFLSTPSRRTLITFLSEITSRDARGFAADLAALGRDVGWRMKNIVGGGRGVHF